MDDLFTNVENRKWLIERIRAEIVGPDPVGPQEIVADPDKGQDFQSYSELKKPRTTTDGEEVLWQDPPLKRYGAGILFPSESLRASHDAEESFADDQQLVGNEISSDSDLPAFTDEEAARNEKTLSNSDPVPDQSEEGDAYGANDYLPSSMGISFLADLSAIDGFRVELCSSSRLGDDDELVKRSPCGRYFGKSVYISKSQNPDDSKGENKIYFRQSLLTAEQTFPSVDFPKDELLKDRLRKSSFSNFPTLQILVVSRPWKSEKEKRLITVSLINRTKQGDGDKNELALFQAGFRVTGVGSDVKWVKPYPEYTDRQSQFSDDESKIARLNYRRFKTYAIGHGCAADWFGNDQDGVSEIWSDVMPTFEMPTTTPDLSFKDENGVQKNLKVSMRDLAGLSAKDDPFDDLRILLERYGNWIATLKERRRTDKELVEASITDKIIDKIEHVEKRVVDGFSLIQNGPEDVRKAFQLANEAMYIAQTRGKFDTRLPQWKGESNRKGTWVFDSPYVDYDSNSDDGKTGFWRPFQIAFLLMSLKGLADPTNVEREEVDLIWFPTGGGKTEAYLGVIAFLLFLLRIRGDDSGGVKVLMRYTLRLLTAQQFERAATLFCSMEYIRKRRHDLGSQPFTIGLWVGSATSPNTRETAKNALSALKKNQKSNPFILRRCPWCAAKYGPVIKKWDEALAGNKYKTRSETAVIGYVRDKDLDTVVFQCPDHSCEFSKREGSSFLDDDSGNKLPVCLIDEDLKNAPPHLLVATVDKFALLAWQPDLRQFFGRDKESGRQVSRPPSLIIQDELHLISGPLGSIVGAYETILDELCTDRTGDAIVRPKIIASTATISRAEQQVSHLYARDTTTLFPPSGFDANSSFFAEENRDENGQLRPGRMYVGVMAPAHMSLQTTEARVFANLLQWPNIPGLTAEERDPWWTLLCFFNSLRELGSASTLLIADAREYLRVISDRHNSCDHDELLKIRSPFVEELTSRIYSDEIPEKLAQLSRSYIDMPENEADWDWEKRPVDVCLASSIIEVGVDVPRLSLMTVVGQPKTTAQYIQVTSRIGRRSERPGLVFTLYGAGKSRDRSHYEKFKSYHQKVYSFVEPTSVTPFSIPAVERTLHALLVAFIRQRCAVTAGARSPTPVPFEIRESLRDEFETILRERVEKVSSDQVDYVLNELNQLFDDWTRWRPAGYGSFSMDAEDPQLMHVAGQTPPDRWDNHSWPTLLSMRGVDASAEAEVTLAFNEGTRDER